jgi:hypothetical protein
VFVAVKKEGKSAKHFEWFTIGSSTVSFWRVCLRTRRSPAKRPLM